MPTTLVAALLLASCTSGSGGGLFSGKFEITTGECEGSPDAKAVDTAGGSDEPGLWAESMDGDLLVHLDNTVANCCPSPGADVTVEGATIDIRFEDVTADDSCDCVCITDFTVAVTDLSPGDYVVTAYFDGTLFGTVDATL